MYFLAMLGFLGIAALVIYVIYYFNDQNNAKKSKLDALVKFSKKAQEFKADYQYPSYRKKFPLTNQEYENTLRKIVSEPEEYKLALENYKMDQDLKIKGAIKERENRKVGYKYQEEIFTWFEYNKELSRDDIIVFIINSYHVDTNKANEIFNILKENSLISPDDIFQPKKWKVAHVLTS